MSGILLLKEIRASFSPLVFFFFVAGGMLKVKNDGSLFPKIDFCVRGPCTSHGPDEDGKEILSPLYIFTRGKKLYMIKCNFHTPL